MKEGSGRAICKVVSDNSKGDSKINNAIKNGLALSPSLPACQFNKRLPDVYELEGEHFCIMHLPLAGKNIHGLHDKSKELVEVLLKEGFFDYDFVDLQEACFNLDNKNIKEERRIKFVGASLHSCKFQGNNISSFNLSFEYSYLNRITDFIGIRANEIGFYDVTIKNKINIVNCSWKKFQVTKSDFEDAGWPIPFPLLLDSSSLSSLLMDYGNYCGLALKETEVEELIFEECTFKSLIEFNSVKIKGIISIVKCNFYTAPSFFNVKLAEDNIKLDLPKRGDFSYKQRNVLNELRTFINFFKLNFFNKEMRPNLVQVNSSPFRRFYRYVIKYNACINNIFDQENIKLQKIYNIAKKEGILDVQADYVSLINSNNEKNTKKNIINRIISIAYGYKLYFGNWGDAFFLSLKGIVKPYYMFVNDVAYNDNTIYFLGFIQTSISIILIALFIVALRWNFRRRQD